MSLDVTLTVNGERIGHIHIVNRGPTSDAEGADPEGERRYVWDRSGVVWRGGVVRHRRGDGAWALVQKVLADAGGDGG